MAPSRQSLLWIFRLVEMPRYEAIYYKSFVARHLKMVLHDNLAYLSDFPRFACQVLMMVEKLARNGEPIGR